MTEKLYVPIHPGEVLKEDFIAGFGIESQYWLNLQSQYGLELAQERVADRVTEIKPLQVA